MEKKGRFRTRGVVVYPEDLSWAEWPERAAAAKLTTLALHHGSAPSHIAAFLQKDAGQRYLQRCAQLGLEIEYELHAMGELLPRALFDREPSLFRQDENGNRTPDSNLCIHSEKALEIVAQNALAICTLLHPTTG